MKAVLGTGAPGPVVGEISLNNPGAGEVLVEIEASAVCTSELFSFGPGLGISPQPAVVGHSASGRVLEAGPGVKRLRVGDRVAVCSTLQCGACWFCEHGSPDSCVDVYGQSRRIVGMDGDGRPVAADLGIGAHAERMLYTESALVAVESDLPPEPLALLGCGILSGVGAVLEVAMVTPGQSVAVIGTGPLGLWMIQGARVAGAETIIAIDPIPERREIALKLGATHALDASDDIVAQVKELTDGRGVDVGLEAAGSTKAMEQSFAMTRSSGVVVPTGIEGMTATVTLNGIEYAIGGRQIRSSQGGGGNIIVDVPKYAQLLNDGLLRYAPYITGTYGIDDVAAAYEAVRDRTGLTNIIHPASRS
jgi:S-(hydroxymethyl)glutathione dehydrogenase/alcohol dehydrogenase